MDVEPEPFDVRVPWLPIRLRMEQFYLQPFAGITDDVVVSVSHGFPPSSVV